MVIKVSGEGKKETTLREILRGKWHTVRDTDADVWVMPLPYSKAEEKETDALRDGTRLIVGITDERFAEAARGRGCVLHCILKDDAYTAQNTLLSAEGAIFFAMTRADIALNDSACLVIGNGRLGTALYRMLTGLGARVTVAARRQTDLHEMPMEKLREALPRFDFVFNTVPSPILTRKELQNASNKTLFLELASAPYGIDGQAAKELGLQYALESGIPGRYCPGSSAMNIAEYLERSVLNHE